MTDNPQCTVVPGIKIGSRMGENIDAVFITIHPLPFYLQAMGDHTFWFTCFLATVILLLPVVAWRFYRADVSPTLTDRARLRQRTDRKAKPKPEFRPFSGRRSRSVSQSVNGRHTWARVFARNVVFCHGHRTSDDARKRVEL